jgi:UDP-2-acetamido-2,6-beta-L-arabino-hexul-4-ose reductase
VKRIVVTGARGFIGRHVTSLLAYGSEVKVSEIIRETSGEQARAALAEADAVIHLAGVNRPQDQSEFESGNAELTRWLVSALREAGRNATVVLASSTRADDDTPYGRSKREAEAAVRMYGEQTGASIAIYRLPNVFGKWSRPFYNTVVATFCHSIARDLPIDVHDPARTIRLVYGEDVAQALIESALDQRMSTQVEPVYERALGEIVALSRQFKALRTELRLPDFSDSFVRKLYTTYVSFLPEEEIGYALQQYADERGTLAELLKSPWFGQIFVSRTRPGVTRGNHFHQTKTEKFVVVEGDAVIRMRPSDGGDVVEIAVQGRDFRVVDIPPGYTHSITNIGDRELVTLFWSSEIFDRERPDTYALPV